MRHRGQRAAAIDRETYDVVPIGIAKDGRWVLESGDPATARSADPTGCPRSTGPARSSARPDGGAGSTWSCTSRGSRRSALGDVDVVLPLLHGPWGEDGTIQGMLEMAGVRYVGAGCWPPRSAWTRHYMKVVFAAAGLPVLPSPWSPPREWATDPEACRAGSTARATRCSSSPPGGSSIGISKVDERRAGGGDRGGGAATRR